MASGVTVFCEMWTRVCVRGMTVSGGPSAVWALVCGRAVCVRFEKRLPAALSPSLVMQLVRSRVCKMIPGLRQWGQPVVSIVVVRIGRVVTVVCGGLHGDVRHPV